MMAASRWVIIAVAFVVVCLCWCDARRQSPLLIEEAGKGRSRSAECQFGKQMHELGTTWHADLGPPFGVMYCIKCQCVPFQKKRRIVARVQCKNIKNDCPKPQCDEPVLLPGRCCKTCPEFTGYSPDIAQDVAPVMTQEEEEKNMKHFAAILTGRTSLVLHRDDAVISSSPVQQQDSVVATGRFTFHKKHLYYSFYTSAATRPKSLQFVDHQGNILEEQALGGDTPYQNATGKLCGVWKRVARDYRKLLREEKVYATLLWATEEISLSGPVARYHALSTELFSSLLAPSAHSDRNAMKGAGGTAIVTAFSSAPSIHVVLIFNGVFSPKEVLDVPLVVRLETTAEKQSVMLLEEVVKVGKPAYEVNKVEFKSAVTLADLRQLTRGKLRLVVENKNNPELRLEGRIQTRTTCEVFQSLVSLTDSDSDDGDSGVGPGSALTSTPGSSTAASGIGLFYVNKDGALVYNIQLDGLQSETTPILALVSGRSRRRVELEDLTPSLADGNATGLLDRLSPKELEQLYGGDLAVNVATEAAPSLIRGRLAGRPVADARDSAAPVLFRRRDLSSPAKLVGLAWAAVDMECTLHYEILLAGLPEEKRIYELHLEEIPFVAPGAPVSRRLLDEFAGAQLEGFVDGLTAAELARMESSVNYLEVRDQASGQVMLRTKVLKVNVPTACLPHYTDNSVPAAPASSNGENDAMACYHEERFREDGAQWRSAHDTCVMCNCQRGRVKCDTMTCPAVKCNTTQAVPGECCPVCAPAVAAIVADNSTAGRGCSMAGEFHAAGSSWHPYVPPHGFDTCAVCTCDMGTLRVSWSRVQCPRLTCDEQQAFRPEKKACCKQCPEPPPPVPREDGVANEQASVGGLSSRTPEDILAAGGCRVNDIFENGREWHPRVYPHGEEKCVKCRCKDGKVGCERKRCSRASCGKELLSKEKDECCPQCRRKVRHHKATSPTYS